MHQRARVTENMGDTAPGVRLVHVYDEGQTRPGELAGPNPSGVRVAPTGRHPVAMEPREPDARWTADFGHLRASDADRERVVDALKTAFVQGRLSRSELDQRTGHALVAMTYGEPVGATAGIRARPTPTAPRPRPTAPTPTRPVDGKFIAWVVALVIALPTAGIAFFDTTYGSFFVLLLIGFFASGAIGSPGRPGDNRHRA